MAERVGKQGVACGVRHAVHPVQRGTCICLVGVVAGQEQPEKGIGLVAFGVLAPCDWARRRRFCEVVTKAVEAVSRFTHGNARRDDFTTSEPIPAGVPE